MFIKVWHLLLYEHLEDVVVDYNTYHSGVVVHGYKGLQQLGEHPEGFFFAHYFQKSTNYEIKSLTISDFGISDSVCDTDTS